MYKGYISLQDLVWVPVYFIALFLLMWFIRNRKKDQPLYRDYFLKGYVFKIACTILYCLLIYYYWGVGDTINYFKNVLSVKHLIDNRLEGASILLKDADYLKDRYSMEGTSSDTGWLLERMTYLLAHLSFFRFITTSMLFATIAYFGMFRMFEAFAMMMPGWEKRLSFAVLFFPTVAIYGSGILKDTICIASMGWLVYASNQIFFRHRFRWRYVCVIVFCSVLVFLIKAYIIAAFLVPYLIFLIMLLVNRVSIVFFRRLFFPVIIGILSLTYMLNAEAVDNMLGRFAVEKLFDNIREQQRSYMSSEEFSGGSSFDIGTIEPSMAGFVKKMPAGINATLFRPYVWESKTALMAFAALESLILLALTLYVLFRSGLFRFLKSLTNPYVFLFVTYSLLFAAVIGLSTANFGTLGRYRIPIVPFYIAGMLYILYLKEIKDPKKPHGKTGSSR